MKIVVSVYIFAVVAVLVAAAPTLTDNRQESAMIQNQIQQNILREQLQQEFLRDKRHKFSHHQFISPCAAAAGAVPVVAPAAAYPYAPSYGAPTHGYPSQSHYGYNLPHYRSEEEMQPEQEMFSFSDMEHVMSEHVPMSRYAIPSAAHAGIAIPSGYGAPIVAAASGGPAFGVFPNANVGGCNVPLLLSCSPSIVQGHMVQGHGQPHIGYEGVSAVASGNAYRDVDEQHLLDHHHEEHEQVPHAKTIEPSHDSTHQ